MRKLIQNFGTFLVVGIYIVILNSSPGTAQNTLNPFIEDIKLLNKLFKEGDYSGVIKIIKAQPELLTNPKSLYLRARSYQELGDNNAAIKAYDAAIKQTPNDPRLYSNRGLCFGSMGDLKRAIRDFDKAIGIDKSFEAAYVNRGVAKGALKEWKAAIDDFTSAIKIKPEYGTAWRNRGILREAIGDLKGACADWQKASLLGQNDAKNWIKTQCRQ